MSLKHWCVTEFVLTRFEQVSHMTDSNFGFTSVKAAKSLFNRFLVFPGIRIAALSLPAVADEVIVVRECIELEEQARFDALLAAFGRNKNFPAGYELQALLGHL